MQKSVTLHVGLPKTGTTTIQKYLQLQDEKLRSLGFLYPGPREHEALGRARHTLLLSAMIGKRTGQTDGLDPRACREVITRVFEEFHQSDLENLIWSCEGLSFRAQVWDTDYLMQILAGADVRIVFFARYVDDWVESFVKERIKSAAAWVSKKPMPPLAPRPGADEAAAGGSMLEKGARFNEDLRVMRKKLPSAEIVVRSFDVNREAGRVVTGALEAMGLPVKGAFPDADDEAGVKNATKSDLYSMLLYHLIVARAEADVIRAVGAASRKRDRRGEKFEPLSGRRFRFLSDEDVMHARGYYEELRQEYPDLPEQPPYVSRPAERRLPKDEGVALLDWLRPDISDAIFDQACAAYPEDLGG